MIGYNSSYLKKVNVMKRFLSFLAMALLVMGCKNDVDTP